MLLLRQGERTRFGRLLRCCFFFTGVSHYDQPDGARTRVSPICFYSFCFANALILPGNVAFEALGTKLAASPDERESIRTEPPNASIFTAPLFSFFLSFSSSFLTALPLATTVKLTFSFLLSYPLAGILKRLPDGKPLQKNIFIIL